MLNSENVTLLHIGAPKTASSAIQKYYFSYQEYAKNLGKPFNNTSRENRYVYDIDNKIGNYIISDEDLLLPLDYSETIKEVNGRDAISDLRFSKPPEVILLVVRDQASLINSWFHYHFKRGRVESLSFSEFWNTECSDTLKNYILNCLDYKKVLDNISIKYPNSNIKVFTFEDVKEDLSKVIDYIEKSFGVSTELGHTILRENDRLNEVNHLGMPLIFKKMIGLKNYNRVRRHFGKPIVVEGMKEKEREEIFHIFKKSNQEIFDIYKLNKKHAGRYY
ncbi:hypothetical protein VCHA35O141_60170 [Vibrio chagasii]|uniref:hypothetical protein n=1 Tax=Vibrio chagasii TaxID=170679 RepID=UPI00337CC0F3|nr:hypothetical protein VCHA38P215_110015 [Vibrio chagasii]CAH6932766.1 hypothetical protein VCHA48P434_110172 [Vibrio chagasii]CAH7038171.1 hypothetical protein VCHA31O73_60033 [Vibrio chagasii]CAH7061908.1 hypothetical protein VCHA35O141_60170 [Vibrio chagasii]CAH7089503.1 hypothetical protein VCHA35O143_70172 [Vibrio chagasii]